jgi:molybdopterin-binding protein
MGREDTILVVTPREFRMKVSARNVLRGTVRKVTPGAVNSEVLIELSGGETIAAVITKESVKSLVLKKGKTAYAIIKASDVIVGAD